MPVSFFQCLLLDGYNQPTNQHFLHATGMLKNKETTSFPIWWQSEQSSFTDAPCIQTQPSDLWFDSRNLPNIKMASALLCSVQSVVFHIDLLLFSLADVVAGREGG